MFFLLPLLRGIAHHHRTWVGVACGALLFAGGIGVSLAGIAVRQPAITRIGLFLVSVAIVLSAIVVRSRRSRTPQVAADDEAPMG